MKLKIVGLICTFVAYLLNIERVERDSSRLADMTAGRQVHLLFSLCGLNWVHLVPCRGRSSKYTSTRERKFGENGQRFLIGKSDHVSWHMLESWLTDSILTEVNTWAASLVVSCKCWQMFLSYSSHVLQLQANYIQRRRRRFLHFMQKLISACVIVYENLLNLSAEQV